MSTKELIELAQLDAMGLLDEQEARQFEQAMSDAPEEVRENIRREQARLCVIEPVLPDVEPPPSLKLAVMASVRAAMAEDAVAKAAVAAVSAPQAPAVATVKETPSGESRPAPVMSDADRLRLVRHEAAEVGSNSGSRRRVSQLWRTGALAMAAAAVVFAATTVQMREKFRAVERSRQNDQLLAEVMRTLGVNLADTLFDTQTKRVIFAAAPDQDAGKAVASIFVNPNWETARLFCLNLPTGNGETYSLVALDEENNVVRELIPSFKTDGQLIGQDFSFRPEECRKIAICARSSEPGAKPRLILAATLPQMG